MKKRYRLTAKATAIAALLTFLILAPFFVLPAVSNPNFFIKDIKKVEQNAFIMLWHIESFEGGSASQTAFLDKFALDFNKQNSGVFIIIKKFSPEQAKLQLENGNVPDMVSFGVGAGELFTQILQPFSGAVYARPEIAEGGTMGGATYAVPWCMGGYMLSSRKEVTGEGVSLIADALKFGRETKREKKFSLGYGGQFNLSLAALLKNNAQLSASGLTAPVDGANVGITQYAAYERFIANDSFNILLGSQRDYFRLRNRIDSGSISELDFEFLEGFSDLVQYMGIVVNEPKTAALCEQIIMELTAPKWQSRLTEVGMFCVTGKKIYSDSGYARFETALNKPLITINVFTSASRIDELKNLCFGYLLGQTYARETIKNLLQLK